jgi:hypothetical protein
MRWLVLTVCWIPLVSGCAPAVQVGLANGPRLGGSGLGDEGIQDVVANGGDSCGRSLERGPLRGRVPPCPTIAHPFVGPTWSPAVRGAKGEGLDVPWLKHFYEGWPCAQSTKPAETKPVAWALSGPLPTPACHSR